MHYCYLAMAECGFTASVVVLAAKLTWGIVDSTNDTRKKLMISGYAESSNKPLKRVNAEANAEVSIRTTAYIQLRKLSPTTTPQRKNLIAIDQASQFFPALLTQCHSTIIRHIVLIWPPYDKNDAIRYTGS